MKKPDVWLGLFLPFSILGIIQNYAYENLTRKFIHRHFVFYLLKLYHQLCNYCFNLEVFFIPPKKVKNCQVNNITLETA